MTEGRCYACGQDPLPEPPAHPNSEPPAPAVIDAAHLAHQRQWSEATFGPGPRTLGVLDHIRKELAEIEADPTDLSEWVDVIILAYDGAWRAGWEPQQIIDAIKAKQARNEARSWPDWRTMSADQAIEHDRSAEPPVDPDTDPLAELRAQVERDVAMLERNIDDLLDVVKSLRRRIEALEQAADAPTEQPSVTMHVPGQGVIVNRTPTEQELAEVKMHYGLADAPTEDTEPSTEGPYSAWRVAHPWGEWWHVGTEREHDRENWTAKCGTEQEARRIAAALNAAGPSPEVQAVVEAAKAETLAERAAERRGPRYSRALRDARLDRRAAVDALIAKEATT